MRGRLMATWRAIVPRLRGWWAERGVFVLRIVILFLGALTLLKLGDEFRRLLFEQGPDGAIDLKQLHLCVQGWFAGQAVYQEFTTGVHPPATHVLLWPLLGWLSMPAARWLWAIVNIGAMIWLCIVAVRESGADSRLEAAFVVLMVLSMNAMGVCIGNGQLTILLLPVLLTAILLLRSGPRTWLQDLLAALLLLVALVKVPIALPFLWIPVLAQKAVRPVVLALAGYLGLSLVALPFQEAGLLALVEGWMARTSALAASGGYGHLHIWLATLGLGSWSLPVSLAVLLLLGAWVWHNRRVDLWLLLGVTAIVARLWTYHRLYDDLLILIPMITLYRFAKSGADERGSDVMAALLLTVTIAAMLMPARLGQAAWPWSLIFTGGHVLVWLVDLVFLLYRARRERLLELG